MSRQQDLKFAEAQIQALRAEAVALQEAFQKYDVEVTQSLREILTEAGVFEQVNKLEQERIAARQRMQQRLQALTQQAEDTQKARSFLLGRERQEQAAAAEAENEKLVEEVIEPVEAPEPEPEKEAEPEETVTPEAEEWPPESEETAAEEKTDRPSPTPPL